MRKTFVGTLKHLTSEKKQFTCLTLFLLEETLKMPTVLRPWSSRYLRKYARLSATIDLWIKMLQNTVIFSISTTSTCCTDGFSWRGYSLHTLWTQVQLKLYSFCLPIPSYPTGPFLGPPPSQFLVDQTKQLYNTLRPILISVYVDHDVNFTWQYRTQVLKSEKLFPKC